MPPSSEPPVLPRMSPIGRFCRRSPPKRVEVADSVAGPGVFRLGASFLLPQANRRNRHLCIPRWEGFRAEQIGHGVKRVRCQNSAGILSWQIGQIEPTSMSIEPFFRKSQLYDQTITETLERDTRQLTLSIKQNLIPRE